MSLKSAWNITKETFSEWNSANVSRLASSLAYYTVFSITPLLVIAIAVAGAIFGTDVAQREVSAQLDGLLGPTAATAVEGMVRSASSHPSGGILATIVGAALLIYGAAGVFTALQDSLNTIWGVKPKPGLSFWHTVKLRLFSFGMVIGMGFLLLVSLVVSAGLSALNRYLRGGAVTEVFWQVVNLLVSLGVFGLVFAMVFKFLPDVRLSWQDVSIGAVITAVLFSVGKTLIGLYLGHSSVASVYGAAGSLVLLLLWVYYSAQILFLGAEFTRVYAERRRHRPVTAEKHAVALTEDDRCKQGIPHPETVEAAAHSQHR